MAQRPPLPRYVVRSGYLAFAAFAFLGSLYLTFPYDAVGQRIQTDAAAGGLVVRIRSVGPGLAGITARGLEIARPAPPEADGPPAALMVDKVALRPSLFPLGVAVSARAFGGEIDGAVGGLTHLVINLDLSRVDPAQGNLRAATGLDLEGRLDGRLRLSIPRVEMGPGASKRAALSQSTGEVRLEGTAVILKGGTVTIPLYGQPTPIDLPRVVIGDLEGRLIIDKGVGRLEGLRTRSDELEVVADGSLQLNDDPTYSDTNFLIKIKANPEFVKRLGLIGSGLSMLPPDPAQPDFRVAQMTGYLGRPQVAPARQ